MARVVTNKQTKRHRIQFEDETNTRMTIYLPKMRRDEADAICRHVKAILSSKITRQPLSRETSIWVKEIPRLLRDKLIKVRLLDAPRSVLLKDYLDDVILDRPDVKPATLTVWEHSCRNLIAFFGAERDIRTINAGECDQFKAYLFTEKLAPATIAKRLKFVKGFFGQAVKHKYIEENPFADVKLPTVDNTKRQFYVTAENIEKVLAIAPPIWRVIIALARFGGLRSPTEVLSLKWENIDFEKGEMVVLSPKTERYDGKESRLVPIFADLRPYLEEALTIREPGQERVVGGDFYEKAQTPKGWANCNLSTQFKRLISQAGLTVWPKLFHNLRSSKVTDLLDARFPVQTVARWMGHDPKVCLEHYAQTTEEHFEAAKGNVKNNAKTTQNPTQQKNVDFEQEWHTPDVSLELASVYARLCDLLQKSSTYQNGAEGI